MNAIAILVGIFLLYELARNGGLGGLVGAGGVGASPRPTTTATGGSAAPVLTSATGQPIAAPTYTFAAPQSGGSAAGAAALGVSAGLNFVPVVGPIVSAAFSALTGGLLAASARRASQARSENQAVAAAVPGWDSGVEQTVAAYNNGQISASQAEQILGSPRADNTHGVLWQNYWKEVSPVIQPGRNGCQSGTVVLPWGQSFCSGSYGAACCVGYDNLDMGAYYIIQALQKASKTGQPVTSHVIPTVFSSKYGGVNRPGYSVTWRPPGSASKPVIQL